MVTDAVHEAIELLKRRRSEVEGEIDLLNEEASRIDRALGALNAGPPAEHEVEVPTERSGARRVSVRAYVSELLEGADQRWSTANLVARIEEDVAAERVWIQVANLPSAVRSAVWSLVTDEQARRVSDDKVVASKWWSPEGPGALPVDHVTGPGQQLAEIESDEREEALR